MKMRARGRKINSLLHHSHHWTNSYRRPTMCQEGQEKWHIYLILPELNAVLKAPLKHSVRVDVFFPIVMTLNLFNIYSDDLRYLQTEPVSRSTCRVTFQVFIWRIWTPRSYHMWAVLRVRKTNIFSALHLLFWTWVCFDVAPRLFYFCPRHSKKIYKKLEFYQFQ